MHATDIVAYTFDADIYRPTCTENAYPGVTRLDANPEDFTDSEGNEVHAVFLDGSESDTPSHCGNCHVFIENELTSDGYDYVVEAISEGSGDPSVLRDWWGYYGDDILYRNVGQLQDLAREIVPKYLAAKVAIANHAMDHLPGMELDEWGLQVHDPECKLDDDHEGSCPREG